MEDLGFPVSEIGLITSYPHAWGFQMRNQQAHLSTTARIWAIAKGFWLFRRLTQMAQATSLGHMQKNRDLLRARPESLEF